MSTPKAPSREVIRRVIHPEIKVLDEVKGLMEYVASDQTLDHYDEVIMADGWRFNYLQKNAPFVDSHNYGSIATILGRIVDYKVESDRLVEVVQWAKDIPDTLAAWGWKMAAAGFLKAVSVGFWPVSTVSKWDQDKTGWLAALARLGLHEEDGVRAIYLEQEQCELSACVLGANPNAVAKAFKAGALSEQDIDKMERLFSKQVAQLETAARAPDPAIAQAASRRLASDFGIALELKRVANRCA